MERANDNVQQNMMLPPLPGTFKDREELINYVRDFGASQGYVMTIKKSLKEKRVILGCDRGGVYRSRSKSEEPKRKRKASSRLINCPFEAVGRKDDDVWILRIKNGEHNHEPLKDMSEHPYSRRFTEEEVRLIKEMTEAGVKPRQVLETLRQSNPMLQSTPRHLYNLKAKIRQGNFSEQTFKSWRPDVSSSAPADKIAEGAFCDRTQQLKLSNFIGGKFLESRGSVFVDVVNPATQEVVSQVPRTTYEEVKSAISAAKQAFPSWKNTPISTRRHITTKLQQLIHRNIDNLALSISIEQGQTLKRAHADILRALEVVQHACGITALQVGEFVPNTSNGIDMYSIRVPLGVCAGICQFNSPAMVPLLMFPIAVICGNTCILKPSEKTPGASMKLAALAVEAGLPDGVLNIVHGGNDINSLLCDDDDIKAISFVGSYRAGMDIYAKAAARGKFIQAHMESRNYAVVLPDACMETTLDALVAASFGAAGEQCMSLSSVIFVGHSTLWEDELVKRAKALIVNGGTDARADVGPVISKEAKDMICRSVQRAVESGARLILDGRNIVVPGYEKGNFVGPTILSGITTSMDCYKEDIYGPVLLCTQVSSVEEAITIVNQQNCGSGASIFTTSGVAARKFQNAVEAAQVGVNVPPPISLPFSSTGLTPSSTGNLNCCGKSGLQFYTQVKLMAQNWRDLPTRGTKMEGPTNQRDTSNDLNQAAPMALSSSSDTDLSSSETSSSVPGTSERGNRDLARPPNMSSIRNDPSSSEASTAFPAMSLLNLPNQETHALPSTGGPKRTYMPPIAQDVTPGSQITRSAAPLPSERRYTTLPTHQNDDSDCISQRNDVTIPIFQSSDHTSQGSETLRHETTERVYLSTSSHGNKDAGVSSQRTDSIMHSSSERSCVSKSHGFDAIGLHMNAESLLTMASQRDSDSSPTIMRTESTFQLERADTVTPAASETMYMPTISIQRSDNIGLSSQKLDGIAPTSENMYMAQRSDDMQQTTETFYMPTSSQRAYDQNTYKGGCID